MIIKFLRDCIAPQEQLTYCCESCGFVSNGWKDTSFSKNEVIDPNEHNHRISITKLKYKEDFEIVEYP
jgi:hypothetical protein